MTNIQLVNTGQVANDGTGDKLRPSFMRVNASLTALNSGKIETSVVGAAGGVASLGPDGKVPASQLPTSSGGVTVHGNLTGLGADDHPQYLTASRGASLFAAIMHTHALDDVAGLVAALAGKQPAIAAENTTGTGNFVKQDAPTINSAELGTFTAAKMILSLLLGTAGTTNKIDLYDGRYGFGVSAARLSYVANGIHAFYSTTTLVGQITTTGYQGSIGQTTPAAAAFTNVTATNLTVTNPIAGSITGNSATVSTINGKIASGTNINITGAGTDVSPYVINNVPGTTSAAVVFTANGTFNKADYPWATRAYVVAIGGGAGGGSGSIGDNASARVAGGGGAPGVTADRWFALSQLPATVPVTIGAGGVGGASVTSSGAAVAGNAGTDGGTTSFGDVLNAVGGSAGNGGPVPAANATGGALRNPGIQSVYYTGAGGLAASSGTTGAAGGRSALGAGAGGAGGGTVATSGASRNGGQGGGTHTLGSGISAVGGGGLPGAVGTNYVGSDGTSHSGTGDSYFGEGGGGGSANASAMPGHGGKGGDPGGGGGGGAAMVYPSGTMAGAGGAGGRGEVIVYLYA